MAAASLRRESECMPRHDITTQPAHRSRRRHLRRRGRRRRSRRRDGAPAIVVDDVGVRVVARRTAAPRRVTLEIELEFSPNADESTEAVVGSRAAGPQARDELREGVAVALAVLAGFAIAATVASLIAIML